MNKLKIEYLGVLFFIALIAKLSMASINVAEALVAVVLGALVGLQKILDFKNEKELSSDEKINISINKLEERLKSLEAKGNMEQFAKTQRR